MNTLHKGTPAILVLAICVAGIDAQACGEVMNRMGGALRYHAFMTRHPAEVLLYVDPAEPLDSRTGDQTFHGNLEKAGHRVTLARGPDELTQALAARPYDVIIARSGTIDHIAGKIAAAPREPTLIPVLDRGAANERELRERFPRLVGENANLNQFLKVIEQSMLARGS